MPVGGPYPGYHFPVARQPPFKEDKFPSNFPSVHDSPLISTLFGVLQFEILVLTYSIMTLLKGHSQGRETVLGCQSLVGAIGNEQSHDFVMVLLGSHVQWSEPIL